MRNEVDDRPYPADRLKPFRWQWWREATKGWYEWQREEMKENLRRNGGR